LNITATRLSPGYDMETPISPVRHRRKRTDKYGLLIALAVDLLIAVALSYLHGDFFWSLAYFWLPHVVVLTILSTFKLKSATMVGPAYALALHLALYGVLVLTWQGSNSTVWAWYFISLPGSVIGATTSFVVTSRKKPGSRKIVYATGLGTFIGALLAQALALALVLVDISPSKSNDKNGSSRSRRAEIEEMHRFDQTLSDVTEGKKQGFTEFSAGIWTLPDVRKLEFGAQERT
jgi:hypothetical protein